MIAFWITSDATIATVLDGIVTGINEGTAQIMVVVGRFHEICTVTVKKVDIDSIVMNKVSTQINKGKTEQLSVTVNPANTTEDQTITWTSSDDTVATVANDGTVTDIKGGTATITATSANGKTTECSVEVCEIPLTEITITNTETKLEFGKTLKLEYTLNPADTTDDIKVIWTSSDESIATVDQNGFVTAVKTGTVKITAKAGDITSEYSLTIEDKKTDVNDANKDSKNVNSGSDKQTTNADNSTKTASNTPKTGDSMLFVVFGSLMLIAATVAVIFKKKNSRN